MEDAQLVRRSKSELPGRKVLFPAIEQVSKGLLHLSCALENIAGPSAQAEFGQLLNDPNEQIRASAKKALQNLRRR